MKAFFLAAITFCLFLIVADANAGFMARDSQGNTVKLRDTPCESHPWLSKFRAAEMHYEGRDFKACWSVIGSVVVVLDEAGDLSAIPITVFQKEQEI